MEPDHRISPSPSAGRPAEGITERQPEGAGLIGEPEGQPKQPVRMRALVFLGWTWLFRSRQAILRDFYHPPRADQQRPQDDPASELEQWRAIYLAQVADPQKGKRELEALERKTVLLTRLHGLWFVFWTNLVPVCVVGLALWLGLVWLFNRGQPPPALDCVGLGLAAGWMVCCGLPILFFVGMYLAALLDSLFLRCCCRFLRLPLEETRERLTTSSEGTP